MSLDYKPTGNPNWVKGHVANPNGRPKGPTKAILDVKRRLLGKWKTHPVDRLFRLAQRLEEINPEMCAKIWIRLLDSCELEERKKKDSLPPISMTEASSSEADALKILEEMENSSSQRSEDGPSEETVSPSDTDGLADGETPVQVKTSPAQDLPGHQEQ